MSKGRHLNRLRRFSAPQLSVARMAAQLMIFPGRMTRQMSRERLPISHSHHSCTRTALNLLEMNGTVSFGCHDWS